MWIRGEQWRFWIPIVGLLALAVYSGQKLIRSHLDPEVKAPNYEFERDLPAIRGSVYSAAGQSYPFAKSVPYWEYRLDPVALTNAIVCKTVRRRGEPVRPKEAIIKTIADALKIDYQRVKAMVNSGSKRGWRDQYLALSSDPEAHRTLIDSHLVAGVKINEKQVRQYLHGRSLAHVLGSVNAEHVGSAGIEQRYNKELMGTPGRIHGMRDALKRELYDRRKVSINPIPGDDIYLTIDHNIQYEVEEALKWGVREYGAGAGWCVVMDATTGAVMAMASLPDYDPLSFGHASDRAKVNRAIAFTYEPGSVMKVITAATAFDTGKYGPGTLYATNRDDNRYYRLPRDEGHVWEPRMTLKDAIVHSSNIVIGKLGVDLGPKTLYASMRRFGFGQRTGIELPGEEVGILYNPSKRAWDKATWSRAAIGQSFAVTAIQLISAYQSIANDGIRMQPHIIDKIVDANGQIKYKAEPKVMGRTVSANTARIMREVMRDVASVKGTARRAAIRGYSIAGKTGTAQKQIPGIKGYAPGLFRATFCGMIPAGAPRILVLVTLDFDQRVKFHQGGNSAGPVFKRVALASLRYLSIPPDKPEELEEFVDDDEFDKIMDERAKKYGIISND